MYERVVVGTDGSETAGRAVDAAARLASANDATLTVAHAYSVKMPADRRAAWHEAPIDVRWRLSPGTVAEQTVDAAVTQARAAGGHDLEVSGWSQPGRPADVLLDVVDTLGLRGQRNRTSRRRPLPTLVSTRPGTAR